MIRPSEPDFSNTPVSSMRPIYRYEPGNPLADPYVSIITAFYNTGEVFLETARSVFNQSFQQWEWIIVNDASTKPESLAVLDKFRNKDPRVRVMDCSENCGPGKPRNIGVSAARAPYILHFDSDDLMEPTAVEKFLFFLESYPGYSFVKGYSVGFGATNYLWINGFHNREVFLENNGISPPFMIRKSVHEAIGGYDEENRGGLEDWEYYLNAASHGYWGSTIPEFLDWYRRRENHNETWENWDCGSYQEKFREKLKQRYPKLWEGQFPNPQPRPHCPFEPISDQLPCLNILKKNHKRVLFIFPHLQLGGADKFNLDLIRMLVQQYGYEVTIATTNYEPDSWLHFFADLTPDIFIMQNLLQLTDYPRFLRYLIESRQPDVVCVSNSYLGYQLLPYLKAHFPSIPFVDYIHMEEEYWRHGGYARCSIHYQTFLEKTIVASEHLKQWIMEQGGNENRIDVCHINCDPGYWSRSGFNSLSISERWGISDDVPVILYAGRLIEQKQPKVFARVMKEMACKGIPFQALVVGDGPDREWLECFLSKEQLTQVRMLGPVSPEDMRELLSVSDILFIPSKMEGISLAFYEAMAMEVVPVGADVGGQSELITPECGILVTRGEDEVSDYVSALSTLLEDPQRLEYMGKACRNRILTQFNLKDMGSRMVRLFEQALTNVRNETCSQLPIQFAVTLASEAIEQTRLNKVADGLFSNFQALHSHMQPFNENITGICKGYERQIALMHEEISSVSAGYEKQIHMLEDEKSEIHINYQQVINSIQSDNSKLALEFARTVNDCNACRQENLGYSEREKDLRAACEVLRSENAHMRQVLVYYQKSIYYNLTNFVKLIYHRLFSQDLMINRLFQRSMRRIRPILMVYPFRKSIRDPSQSDHNKE